MGLETVNFITDLVTTNPAGSDVRSQGDDHIRNIKTGLQASFPNASRAQYFPRSAAKTANYTVLSTDMAKYFTGDATGGAFSFTLPTLGVSDDGWFAWFTKIDSSANAVTAVGTINGAANKALSRQYQSVVIWWTGTAWLMLETESLLNLNISGGTALTDVALGDEFPLNDVSVPANRKITFANLMKGISILTAETALAVDDTVPIYDLSETAANSMTVQHFFEILNLFTEDTSPDTAADFALFFDASAGTVKKVKPDNFNISGRKKVATQTGGSSAYTFTGLSSTYRRYEFQFTDVVPSTNNNSLIMEVSTDNGANWKTTSYLSANLTEPAPSGGAPAADLLTTSLLISRSTVLGNDAGAALGGILYLPNPSGTTCRKMVTWLISSLRTGLTVSDQIYGGGCWNGGSDAINAVRFRMAIGGNINGTITMIGEI